MATLLIIEDDPSVQNLLRQTLTKAGYNVFTANDGIEGLAIAETRPIDLVITDIFMPRKEGISTIRDLKRRNPKQKIIAISGGTPTMDSRDYLRHAELFGAIQTLRKPIANAELLETINTLLTTNTEECFLSAR